MLHRVTEGIDLFYKYCLLVFVAACFPSLTTQASSKSDAVLATKHGNYIVALNMWTRLAEKGDTTAQYNLGVFYMKGLGVAANHQEASRWFQESAKSGLVQAYNQLGNIGIRPGQIAVKTTVTPQQWIVEQLAENYTLQLASSKSQKLISKYYQENNLHGIAGYYRSLRQGEFWYSLVYGSYNTATDAKLSITTLPKNLRRWSPWVRKIKDIQRITIYK